MANFHTGVIVDSGDGDVILDLKTIRLRYLRSWFIIDLVSTIPVDYLLQVMNKLLLKLNKMLVENCFKGCYLKLLIVTFVERYESIVLYKVDKG